MKVAHVKTVDGTTVMINLKTERQEEDFVDFLMFISPSRNVYYWEENTEICYLFKAHIISVRFREVSE